VLSSVYSSFKVTTKTEAETGCISIHGRSRFQPITENVFKWVILRVRWVRFSKQLYYDCRLEAPDATALYVLCVHSRLSSTTETNVCRRVRIVPTIVCS
jgi:hypothetical protein